MRSHTYLEIIFHIDVKSLKQSKLAVFKSSVVTEVAKLNHFYLYLNTVCHLIKGMLRNEHMTWVLIILVDTTLPASFTRQLYPPHLPHYVQKSAVLSQR